MFNLFKKTIDLSDFPSLLTAIYRVIQITLPAIKKLIESKVVPAIKRKSYETLDKYSDKIIKDLAQNAAKFKIEEDEIKKVAFLEGSKLGCDMLRALAEKLNKAADEIEKVL